MANRGKLIVVEGCDGAGKSEQAKRLFARLLSTRRQALFALYERATELLPGERVAMVDADAAPEVVEARVWSAVEEVVGG